MPARSYSSARPDEYLGDTFGATHRKLSTCRHRRSVTAPQLDLGPLKSSQSVTTVAEMCVSCCRRSGIARPTPLHTVLCGPCWFAAQGTPTAADLTGDPYRPDSRLPHDARSWVREVRSSDWFRARRTDSAVRLTRLLVCLARHADWQHHTTWPTWERLMDATGWSRSTMSSWLAELHIRGWLERVEPGTTPRFRPMALQHLEGNRAAVYQLRVPVLSGPDLDLTRTPTVPQKSPNQRSSSVLTRASQIFHRQDQQPSGPKQKDGPTGPRLDQKTPGFFDLRVPVGPAQMLAAAAELRRQDFAFSRLSSRAIRALLRIWWRAGWTNNDLLQALRQLPTAGGHRDAHRCPASQLRHPGGWIRHRLKAWADPITGTPVVPPSKWNHTRSLVRVSHGAAAARRLRYGQARLTVTDVNATDAERAAAALMLVRRRAGELSDARAAIRPAELIASPEVRQAQLEAIHAALEKHSTAPRATAPPPSTARAATTSAPADERRRERDSQKIWRRALERARSENGGQPRRRRRR